MSTSSMTDPVAAAQALEQRLLAVSQLAIRQGLEGKVSPMYAALVAIQRAGDLPFDSANRLDRDGLEAFCEKLAKAAPEEERLDRSGDSKARDGADAKGGGKGKGVSASVAEQIRAEVRKQEEARRPDNSLAERLKGGRR